MWLPFLEGDKAIDPQQPHFILCVNTGSSSIKAALYAESTNSEPLFSGLVERIGTPLAHLVLKDQNHIKQVDVEQEYPDYQSALKEILASLQKLIPDLKLQAVGHRIVHGGPHFSEPTLITPDFITELKKISPLAPNHLPQAIQVIESMTRLAPDIVQVACFDTAFHRSMPPVAQMVPLPQKYIDAGIIRYGFHGLSYESILQKLAAMAPKEFSGRVLIAHLGNGSSLAAVHGGKPLDTTMGFTPCGGLMMGTRTGDLDPGVLVYLATQFHLTPVQIDQLVNREGGLLGVSGSSTDMRDLLAKEDKDPHAKAAIELFCYTLQKYIGAMIAVLGGIDTLIFTGGIGEHASVIRERICQKFHFLSLSIDQALNQANALVISNANSSITVRVIPTDEDWMIAQHTWKLLQS